MSCTLASLSQPLPTSQTLGVLSGIGTTETVVQLSNGNPAVLSMPATPSVDGVLFKFQTAGIVTSGNPGSIAFTFNVYLGNSATVASDMQLITLGFTPSATSSIVAVDGLLFWSSAWGKLTGLYNSTISNASWSSGLTFGNFTVASQSNLQFVVSATFGTSNASNAFKLTQFELSLV
jgi:hypothetical protein